MGKTRKPKHRNTSDNLLISSLAGKECILFEDVDEVGPVTAIQEQLQCSAIEEKLNGLQALAVLALNKHKIEMICKSDIIRIASPLLCEKDEAVRNAASGALRNLSVNGPDVCAFMVEQDVLTALLALLTEYLLNESWTPTFDADKQMDLRSDVFLQSINLLRNLCESSPIALDQFNQREFFDGLLRCLDYTIFGMDIAISVAQTVLVTSENNTKAWNALNNNISVLINLLNISGDLSICYLSTLAAGILCNVPALSAAHSIVILQLLNRTLTIDHQAELHSIQHIVLERGSGGKTPELEIENMDIIDDETEEVAAARRRRQELPTASDIAVRNFAYLIDAQRLAAETITNLCASDEENWVDNDDDDISENESVVDFDTNAMKDDIEKEDENLPVEIVEAITSFELIQKLWLKSQPIVDPKLQFKSNGVLLNKLKNLRVSCLLCLQNLCNTLSLKDLGGHEILYNVWVELGQQVFQMSEDVLLIEPATSLMRSVLEHLKTYKLLFNQMTENDIKLILNGVDNCKMPEVRANWLRMLGTLGCLLPETLVKVIIAFILETCANEDDVWTISEALDAVMDIFADNDWHQIVSELNMVEVVVKLENMFKSKLRQQRRELNERYAAVQTVKTNFTRFVRYLEKESIKYAR